MRRWLFFDVGSTLVDEGESYRLFVKRCVKVLYESGISVNQTDFEEKMVSFAAENKDPITETWRYFNVKNASRPKWDHNRDSPYPDVIEVLRKLSQSYQLGLIANQGEGLEERLEKWGILSYFQRVVSSAQVGVGKPDARIFSFALENAGVAAAEAIYVGDRVDNDMIPAKKVGMQTIRMKQGLGQYGPEDPLFPSDWQVSSVRELLQII